jgi:hypothetical protein
MHDAFGIVLIVVVVIAALVSIVTLLGSRRLYDQIGRGGLSINDEPDARPQPKSGGAAALRERDDEIRQLLTAANHRRGARGEAQVDVETELRRLTAPVVDAELRDEVRQLVVARNHRLVSRGKEPLDIEAEVERQLRELGA